MEPEDYEGYIMDKETVVSWDNFNEQSIKEYMEVEKKYINDIYKDHLHEDEVPYYDESDMVIVKLRNAVQKYVDNPNISNEDLGKFVRNCFSVLRDE